MDKADKTTQFDYLLNAFEEAAQAGDPAAHNYGEKRRALIAHVRQLEAAKIVLEGSRTMTRFLCMLGGFIGAKIILALLPRSVAIPLLSFFVGVLLTCAIRDIWPNFLHFTKRESDAAGKL